VTELFDERNNPLFERLGSHFEGVASWRAALAEHRAVVTAIAAKDPRRAKAAMHAHLEKSHDRFAAAFGEAAAAEAAAPARKRKERVAA
jgi:DNA-binding FadR family transcriptional regulator